MVAQVLARLYATLLSMSPPAYLPWGVSICRCQYWPIHHSLASLALRAHCYSIRSRCPDLLSCLRIISVFLPFFGVWGEAAALGDGVGRYIILRWLASRWWRQEAVVRSKPYIALFDTIYTLPPKRSCLPWAHGRSIFSQYFVSKKKIWNIWEIFQRQH